MVLNLSFLFEHATNLVFFLFPLRLLFYAVITDFFSTGPTISAERSSMVVVL